MFTFSLRFAARPLLLCSLVVAGCGGDDGADRGVPDVDPDAESAPACELLDTCPERPCEIAAGCTDGRCVYEPLVCGEGEGARSCAPVACEGDDCDDVASTSDDTDKVYPCGEAVCTGIEYYCDPRPFVVSGVLNYGNVCVLAADRRCGQCDRQKIVCDEQRDRNVCEEAAPAPPPVAGQSELICLAPAHRGAFHGTDAVWAGGSVTQQRGHSAT